MRGVALLALGLLTLIAFATGPSSSAAAPATTLRVAFWEGGAMTDPPDVVWTLRCQPARGTLPQPARACAKLAAAGVKLFASTPPDTACTELYGGPQRARIVGIVRGRRVWTTVTRINGCEIARWQRLSPWLLPPGGATR